jgi:asparagine synthase (glutamine-hydrolysing)
MFAFAIWDRVRNRLFLARDRLGKKPLYYGQVGSSFVLTSELKALTCLADFRATMDPEAVAQYFRYRYVPGPRTIFQGFTKLEPAEALTLTDGVVRRWRYWESPFERPTRERLSEAAALSRLDDRLRESVRLRMRSDVPVGALLSGGLDSSIITALMVQETPHRVQTFSVGFRSATGQALPGDVDESGRAQRVAHILGTDHHQLLVDGVDRDALQRVVWHLDEPFGDAAALPTFQIAALARQHVKVVLTGEGADELFGGYRYVQTLYFLGQLERLPMPIRRGVALLASPVSTLPPRGFSARIARALHGVPLGLPERYQRVVDTIGAEQRARLLRPLLEGPLADTECFSDIVALPSRALIPDRLNWLLASLTRRWLPDDLLMKVDKTTMAVGLEARTPFLDHRLFEEVATFPARYKLRLGTSKYLLRRLGRTLLPAEVVRQKKHGFDVPLDAWLRGDLRTLVLDTLTREACEATGVLDGGEVSRLLGRHLAGRAGLGQMLWTVLCFVLWHQQFVGGRRPTAAACDDSRPLVGAPFARGG